MITTHQLTELLGWASIINIGYLLMSALVLILAREFVVSVHSRLFNVSPKDLPSIYFNFLAGYKTLSLIFCIVPYVSLKLMGN